MGLFSSKKIYVSSTISNLAGDLSRRPDYLKTAVLGKTLLGQSESMGDVIKNSYLNGPGVKLRSFYRWASDEDNYGIIGMPTSSALLKQTFTISDLESSIDAPSGHSIKIIDIETGEADSTFWAEQYMLENHANLFDQEWTADFDMGTGEVILNLPGDIEERFIPFNFDPQGLYLYVMYTELDDDSEPVKDAIFIYKRGDGVAAIDNAIQTIPVTNDGFFPFIPVRLENKFLSDQFEPEAYEQVKKAFKKATGGDIKEIYEALEDSDSLADIDNAYVVFGPSLNAKDDQAKKYAWAFFTKIADQMEANGQLGLNLVDEYVQTSLENQDSFQEYIDWRESQRDPFDPDYQTPPPEPVKPKVLPKNSIRISADNNLPGEFDIEIAWNSMQKTSGSGLGKAGAEVGDVWWEYTGNTNVQTTSSFLGSIITESLRSIAETVLYKQVGEDNWEAYTFQGLKHINHIYGGKAVEIEATEALEDTEESGFFLPLHYDTLRSMSLVDSTQLSLVSTQLVMNSYLVKKTSFLKKLLKIAIIIAVIVIVTAIAGPSGGVGIGATIAASIGVTGLTALILSIAINMVVGMIVQAILTEAFTAVFGDVLGSLFATIAAFFVMGGIDGALNGETLASNFGNLMNAQNIIMLTNAVGNGIADYIRASAMDYNQKTEDYIEAGEQKQTEIDNKWIEEFGLTYGVIDPMDLLDPASYTPESSDSFLARRLMTGSDIAELSMDMLTNFAELTLKPAT